MTTDQTQGTTWPTDAEREALAREMYLARARSHVHPDDFMTPEEHWHAGHPSRDLWLGQANGLFAVLAPHIARREQEARTEGRRQASVGCGCVLCCASMPPEMVTSDLHRGSCPAQRADRIERGES